MRKNNVTILDYRFGNQFSITQAFKHLGFNVKTTNNLNEIENSNFIVLPGVGAFKSAMSEIKRLKLDKALFNASKRNVPILGICLGMQLFFDESFEFGETKGLGLISGSVRKLPLFSLKKETLKIPNIGWRKVFRNSNNSEDFILKSIIEGEYFYFLHSYSVVPKDKRNILYSFEFGGYKIPAIIKKKNIVGFQFHPEKSSKKGIELLENYLKILF